MVCTVLTVGFCHILFGTVISVICYFKSCLLGLEFWWVFFIDSNSRIIGELFKPERSECQGTRQDNN